MKEEQLKKLQELATTRKLKQDDKLSREKERLKSQGEIIEYTKNRFDFLKKSILENSNKIKAVLSESKDTVKFYSNDQATNSDDRKKLFAQMLYYVQGTDPGSMGVNTPSILFEAVPAEGKLNILKRTSITPAPLETIIDEPIQNFDEERINSLIMKFIEEMLTRNIE